MTASERINNQPQEKEENSDNVYTYTHANVCVCTFMWKGKCNLFMKRKCLNLIITKIVLELAQRHLDSVAILIILEEIL